ncbi:hypothetical protein LZ554_000871 [Drepanopeziza brunnea f. sp. 'monogermtubi']|nr:hypothetical protein LZ554_000871 [Drepanopeziza brunnea f. sp. 'monogermtubi']
MDLDNLRTASLYINNQLLSRGLLRNGQTIDFARPERGEGGAEATMGRVMGVVNDLILRRDRDATQRETLSTTLRSLRADTLRHTTDMERLQTKHAEAQRKLGIAESAERAVRQQLKGAEQANRVLKEEMARMKVLVQQTRSQCAVEVRKRERTLEGLKKHAGDGRQRGGGKGVGSREITVVAGVGGDVQGGMGSVGVGEEGYDLRSETNEFLTELAKGLSEENENLAALARRTLETLRTLSGYSGERDAEAGRGMVVQMESGYDNLAQETEGVLDHVRTLLTNPSFVPLEEVEVREEEILRLRQGWERMESRWKDAVSMMEGWRQRMARNGQTVNLEELKMGLMLSPLKVKDEDCEQGFQLSMVMEEEDGEGDTQADIDAMDDSGIPGHEEFEFDEDDEVSESSLFEDEPIEEDEQLGEGDEEANYTIHTVSSISPGPAPQLSPLRETSGNIRAVAPSPPQYRMEKEDDGFSTIIEENTYDLLQLASPKKPTSVKSTPQQNTRRPTTPNPTASNLSTPPDEISLLKTSFPPPTLPQVKSRSASASPTKSSRPAPKLSAQATPRLRHGLGGSGEIPSSSRLPRPREQQPMQSPLTMASIAAKLAASEREADAARVRAKIKAARAGRSGVGAGVASVPPHSTSRDNSSSREKEDKRLMPPPPTPKRDVVLGESGAAGNGTGRRRREEGEGEGDGEGEGAENANANAKFSDARSTRKRKARDVGKGRASRRRSTLSPWELESLILGGAGAGASSPGK